MWNIFKRKNKEEAHNGQELPVVSFPFKLNHEYTFIIHWLMSKEKVSKEEAMAQIFKRGCLEMSRRCALDILPLPSRTKPLPRRMREPEKKPSEPAPAPKSRTMKEPFTTCAIPPKHLRIATYFNGNKKWRMARFCNMDSQNLINAGYCTYLCVFLKERVDILLFKSRGGTRKLRKRETAKHKYLMLCGKPVRMIDKEFLLDPDKSYDIPFTMKEGKGCLIIDIKKPTN